MTDSDPLISVALGDADDLVAKLGAELHETTDHVSLKQKFFALLVNYAPAIVEAVLREALSLAGVPLPAPVSQKGP